MNIEEVLSLNEFKKEGFDKSEKRNLENEFNKCINNYEKEVLENIDKNSIVNNTNLNQKNVNSLDLIYFNEDFSNDQNKFENYGKDEKMIIDNNISLDLDNQDIEEESFIIDDTHSIKNSNNYNINHFENENRKLGYFRKTSMTISDLTDDSKLRQSISLLNQNTEQNYIKITDWNLENEENLKSLVDGFIEFEEKFFSNSNLIIYLF